MVSQNGSMTDPDSTRRYDHRRKNLVQATGGMVIATENGAPASTARGGPRQSQNEVVMLELLDLNTSQLQHEVIKLRRRLKKLGDVPVVVKSVAGLTDFKVT